MDTCVRGAIAKEAAVAIGEIGLDYHYDFSPREVQQAGVRGAGGARAQLSLPIVMHTREATEDTFRLLREAGELRGVFHCFTGDVAMARAALDLGFFVSLAGIVTFPKAAELRDVARIVPSDRLLVETDAPYLAPVPFRGKRNEPASWVAWWRTWRRCDPWSRRCLAAQTIRNFDAFLGPTGRSKRLSALTPPAQLHYSEATGTSQNGTFP